MTGNKVGSHIVIGSRNGYGDLAKAGQAVVVSVDDGGVLTETKNAYPNTVTIFRPTEPDPPFYLEAPHGIDQWDEQTAIANANATYPQFKSKWLLNPADYYIVLNEPFAEQDNINVYLAYERTLIDLAHADGFRICMLNLAGGSPTFETWKELVVPHLAYGFSKGAIYGRHAYGGDLYPLDGNTGRPFQEAEYLLSQNLNGGIVITELGYEGGYTYKPSIIENQLPPYDEEMKKHSNIIGGALWTLGDSFESAPEANWQNSIPWMTSYCAANPADKWTPPNPQPPEPTPPPPGATLIFEQYFDKGWWDRTGSQQIPNPMLFSEILGFNPYATDGTGGTHNRFLASENRILDKNGLPENEWEQYLNEKGWTNKNFKEWSPTYPIFYVEQTLTAKQYRLEIDFVGDWYNWVNSQKVLPGDPKHAFCELFLLKDGSNASEATKTFDTLNLLGENQLQAVIDNQDYEGFGFSLCSIWGAKNNGAFVRSFKVWAIEEQPPPDLDCDAIKKKIDELQTIIDTLRQILNESDLCKEPTPPTTEEFYGIDLSYHNVLSPEKWDDLVNNKNVRFVILRLMFGMTPDTRFAEHYQNATNRGLIVLVYGFPVDTIDPIAQADAFIQELAKWTVAGVVSNDVEPWNNTLISFESYRKYVERIRTVRQHQTTYTRKNIYDTLSNNETLGTSLWVADYVFENQPVKWELPRQPLIPTAWGNVWHLWQVSSTDFDGQGSLDINRFNGTWEQFLAWLDFKPEPPPSGDLIDILPYFNPPANVQYMVRHPDGSQERFRTEYRSDGNGWYFVKNNLWEYWFLRGDYIYLAQDISPAPDSTGRERYYQVFENEVLGGAWCPRYMKVGQNHTRPHFVQFYAKNNCQELSENSGDSANNTTLIAHYASMTFSTGITLQDVIEIGNPNGEVHCFARGYGRVAWKSAWGQSEISEIVTNQEPMQREIIPCMDTN